MRTETPKVSAGLIFQGLRDLDIAIIGDRVSKSFEALDQDVTGIRILSENQACISSAHHDIRVSVREDHPVEGLEEPAPMVLELAIDAAETQPDGVPHHETILAHALKSLHWSLTADHVKWVIPGTILSSTDFVKATAQPGKPVLADSQDTNGAAGPSNLFPNIDETNEKLNAQLSRQAEKAVTADTQDRRYAAFLEEPRIDSADDEEIREETAPLRLSVWLISFAVALFALPVGAALLVFNTLKGENLRLSAQAAALTGTFLALGSNEATAEILTLVQGLVV